MNIKIHWMNGKRVAVISKEDIARLEALARGVTWAKCAIYREEAGKMFNLTEECARALEDALQQLEAPA